MPGLRTWAALVFITPLALGVSACSKGEDDRAALIEDELDHDLGRALDRQRDPSSGEDPAAEGAESSDPSPTMIVPTGTTFAVRLDETLGTGQNRAGDAFIATLADPIVATEGTVLIPTGAVIRGRVTATTPPDRAGGTAVIKLAFESVSFDDHSYPLRASVVEATPEQRARRSDDEESEPSSSSSTTAALLGQILGKDTESTIEDTSIGAAAGTAIAMGTRNVDAVLPSGSRMVIRLDAPVEVPRGGR